MSISRPRANNPNPATKHIRFKNGKFQYWDKKEEKNIEITLPCEFIVLDELSAITGWSDKYQSGIFSNEVASTIDEEIVVKAFKGGELIRGLYSEIKDKAKTEGGRYEKSVYALLNGELVRFAFVGAALSSWIETEVNFTQPKYKVEKTREGKKGTTVYKIPVFEVIEAREKEWDEAIGMDRDILQPYLEKYLKKEPEVQKKEDISMAGTPEAKKEVAEKMNEEVKIDDLPFN